MKRNGKMTALAAAGMVMLLIALLFTAIERVAYDAAFYEKEYQKYGQAGEMGMSNQELMDVTRVVIAYLRGTRQDMQVEAHVEGVLRPVFNEKELSHMVDVRALFDFGRTLRMITSLLGISAFFLVTVWAPRERVRTICKGVLWGAGVFVALVAGLAVWASVDFTGLFRVFHHMAFTNMLWELDPKTDLLIRMVPEPFFIDCAVRVALYFVSAALAMTVAAGVVLGSGKKRLKGGSKHV